MSIKKTLYYINQNKNQISYKRLPLLNKDTFIGKFVLQEKLNQKQKNKSMEDLNFNNSLSKEKQKKLSFQRNNLSNSINYNQPYNANHENSKANLNLHIKEIIFPNRFENIKINSASLNKKKWSAKNFDLNLKKIYLKFPTGVPKISAYFENKKEDKINFVEIIEFLKNISKPDNFFGNRLFNLLLKKLNNEDKLNNYNDSIICKTISSDLLKEINNLFPKYFSDKSTNYSYHYYKIEKFMLTEIIKKIFKQLNKFTINQQNITISKEDIKLEYDKQIKLLQNPFENNKINKNNPIINKKKYHINNKIKSNKDSPQKIFPNESHSNLYQLINFIENNKEFNLQSKNSNSQKHIETNIGKCSFSPNCKKNNSFIDQIPVNISQNQRLDDTNITSNKIKNAVYSSNYNNINTNSKTNTSINNITSLNNTTSRKSIITNNTNCVSNYNVYSIKNNMNINNRIRRKNSKNFDLISELIDIPFKNNITFDQKKYKNYISNLLISMSLNNDNNFKTNKKLNNSFIHSRKIKINREMSDIKNCSFDFGKNNRFNRLLLDEPELIKIFNGNLQLNNLKNLKNDIMNNIDIMNRNFNLDVNIAKNYYIQNIFNNYFSKNESEKKTYIKFKSNKKNNNLTNKILINENKNKSSNNLENLPNSLKNNEKEEKKLKENKNKKFLKKEDEEKNLEDKLAAFKIYIKKLKSMSDEEFDKEAFKYLSKDKI